MADEKMLIETMIEDMEKFFEKNKSVFKDESFNIENFDVIIA